MDTFTASFKTPIAPMMISVSEKGLTSANFVCGMPSMCGVTDSVTERYVNEFLEYFAGDRKEFTFPLDITGSEFDICTYYALRNIPYGEVRTYGEIADRIGRPKGARAVGMACNRNPLAIVIPCHRVVGSNSRGGYGWGVDAKDFLLTLEGVKFNSPARTYKCEVCTSLRKEQTHV